MKSSLSLRKKILITGSNGLLGQKLVKLILEKDEFDLIATSRGENRLSDLHEGLHYRDLDICNEKEVDALISELKPHYVINTAAMTNVDACETEREACQDLNVNAVKYLASACKSINAFLVHLSTDFIFDGVNGPYDEEAQANPLSYYGQTKLESEKLLFNSDINYAIVRTVLVYGIAHKMSRSNIILWVKKSLEEEKSIKVVNDQWRSPTLAEDLAIGCYLICQNNANGVFNICGSDFLNPYQMAIATAEYFNLNKALIEEVDGSIFSQTAKRPPKTGLDISKAKRILNYNPHSFKEGIEIMSSQMET